MEKVRFRIKHMGEYLFALVKWGFVGVVVGLIGGVIGSLFHVGVEYATLMRNMFPSMLYFAPLFGLVIITGYKLFSLEGKDTNAVIESVHFGRDVPFRLVPVIFLGTVLTHLCGGSAGREGAALQIGGTIGYTTGSVLHLNQKDMPLATLCGMAGVFSALFGTPLTATLFALEVVSVGVLYYAGLVPCLSAALCAYFVSLSFGIAPTRFSVTPPPLAPRTLLLVIVLSLLCGLVSIVFCKTLHATEHLAQRIFQNTYLRVLAGAVGIICLTLLLGTDYNGAGMELIDAALHGNAKAWAWLGKIVFTAVTIGFGFKGGEVVPSFFVGAAFGCVVGPLLGLPAGFAAAIGLIGVFCGAVNCPVSSVFLSVELFGAEGMWYFAVACAISYLVSGYCGLYKSQTILYSKLHAEFINVHSK